MSYQVHEPNTHDEDEWIDVSGDDHEAAARSYLSDLDPLDYDAGRTFKLHVRQSPGHEPQIMTIAIQPIAWIVNGR